MIHFERLVLVVGALGLAACGTRAGLDMTGGAGQTAAGAAGAAGQSSGAAGVSATSGAAGVSGASGAAGVSAMSGAAGVNGTSGAAGIDATAGPPGTVLAFDADTNGLGRTIYVASLGAPNCIAKLTDPAIQAKEAAFSPDGKTIAYAALVSGTYQLNLLDLASKEVKILTTLPTGATYPAFSPDGSQLAFVTGDPEINGTTQPGTSDVMVMDLAAHATRNLNTSTKVYGSPFISPAFAGAHQILTGNRLALIGIDPTDGTTREVVPITGRIPNPQDPAPSPDGVRYAFSDFCGGTGLNLFIARIDGSTGDTCGNAVAIGAGQNLVSADWGQAGYIAAELQGGGHGIVIVDEKTLVPTTLGAGSAGRNPAWAPTGTKLALPCQ